ncbi:hypothetical protein GVAV_001969 [Gurleya vavrai]
MLVILLSFIYSTIDETFDLSNLNAALNLQENRNQPARAPVNYLDFDFQTAFDELQNNLNNFKDESRNHYDNEIRNIIRLIINNQKTLLNAINSLKNNNFTVPLSTNLRLSNENDNSVFPGTNEDYNKLIPVVSKTSQCGNCSTCAKNGICILNSYFGLRDILRSYPDFSPPRELPSRPVLNHFLKEILTNVSANADKDDLIYLAWSVDEKLGHLISPIFLASLKFQLKKNGKGKTNPALLLALSQGNVDPMTLYALAGDDIDPAMLLAMNNKNVDPSLLMLMQGKKMNPLIFSLMNKNENKNGCTKNLQNRRSNAKSSQNGFDNNLLPFLFNNEDSENRNLLMMMQYLNKQKGKSNGCNNTKLSNFEKVNEVDDGYGRKIEEEKVLVNEEEKYSYGQGYGRV